MSALVSIIMPAYNAAGWIRRAIDSVLQQSWPAVEMIVVDDGSTDSTGEVCRTYGERIRYIRQDNSGVSTARNNGIAHATGDFIGFLDSDDEYLPDMISSLMGVLEKYPQAGIASGAFLMVRPNAQKRCPEPGKVLGGRESGIISDFYRLSLDSAIAWTGAVLVRKAVLDAVGLFRPDLRLGEDLELWYRIAGKYQWACLDKTVALYHNNPASSVTCHSRSLPKLNWLYGEEEMRLRVRPELWESYRSFRDYWILRTSKDMIWMLAGREARQTLRLTSPGGRGARWRFLNALSWCPGWLLGGLRMAAMVRSRFVDWRLTRKCRRDPAASRLPGAGEG